MGETTKTQKTSWFKGMKAEFKKIVWPSRKEVGKNTVTVIVTSLIIGAVIFCMDTVITGADGGNEPFGINLSLECKKRNDMILWQKKNS